MTSWRGPLVLALAGALAVAPIDSTAQVNLALSAGAASYDLAGTGTSATASARIGIPVAPVLDVELGTGYFWYDTQGESRVAMLLPEAGLIAHLPLPVPLYLGAGLGHSLGVKGNPQDDFTMFAALGLDIELQDRWAIRPEMRVRAVDPWVGTIADFTLGVRHRLGR